MPPSNKSLKVITSFKQGSKNMYHKIVILLIFEKPVITLKIK